MNTRRFLSLIHFILLTMAVCISSSALAQFGASLSESVQDPSGAVVPRVTIVPVNTDTQQTRTVVSSTSGTPAEPDTNYQLPTAIQTPVPIFRMLISAKLLARTPAGRFEFLVRLSF
jgi:hypothetical protein